MSASENASLLEEFDWGEDEAMKEVVSLSVEQIQLRTQALENEIRFLDTELRRVRSETRSEGSRAKENQDKVKLNKQLPWLVGNIVEVSRMTRFHFSLTSPPLLAFRFLITQKMLIPRTAQAQRRTKTTPKLWLSRPPPDRSVRDHEGVFIIDSSLYGV